jgi:hypothetical protein
MNYINVRQLTRNVEESTKELPVTVTRFGKPVFKIVPIDGENISIPNNLGKAVNQKFCSFPFCNNEASGMKDNQYFCGEHL